MIPPGSIDDLVQGIKDHGTSLKEHLVSTRNIIRNKLENRAYLDERVFLSLAVPFAFGTTVGYFMVKLSPSSTQLLKYLGQELTEFFGEKAVYTVRDYGTLMQPFIAGVAVGYGGVKIGRFFERKYVNSRTRLNNDRVYKICSYAGLALGMFSGIVEYYSQIRFIPQVPSV